MTKLSGKYFYNEAQKIIEQIFSKEIKNIENAANALSNSIISEGVIHIFGSGHSKSFAMEMVHRAGGLAMMNGIKLEDLILLQDNDMDYEEFRKPDTERNPDNAHELIELHNIYPQDAFIICSNSGRNGVVVEMALEAKRKGHTLIGVTSMKHTKKSESRHPSGKKLYEIADITIDNCGPYGDALLDVEELDTSICSISSIAGGFIAQALTAEITKILLKKGYTPPIFMSLNVEGSLERNEKLKEKYKDRINY